MRGRTAIGGGFFPSSGQGCKNGEAAVLDFPRFARLPRGNVEAVTKRPAKSGVFFFLRDDTSPNPIHLENKSG